MGQGSRREGGPRKLVNIQASFPQSSRPVHSHELEIKQMEQETFVDEQGVSNKIYGM